MTSLGCRTGSESGSVGAPWRGALQVSRRIVSSRADRGCVRHPSEARRDDANRSPDGCSRLCRIGYRAGAAHAGRWTGVHHTRRTEPQPWANSLVEGGLFGHSRNPLYVANMLILLGLAIVHNGWVMYLVVLPLFALTYVGDRASRRAVPERTLWRRVPMPTAPACRAGCPGSQASALRSARLVQLAQGPSEGIRHTVRLDQRIPAVAVLGALDPGSSSHDSRGAQRHRRRVVRHRGCLHRRTQAETERSSRDRLITQAA